MDFKLVSLSPINIGSGNNLSSLVDYIYQDGFVYYINYDKLGQIIYEQETGTQIMDDFVNIVKKQSGTTRKDKYNLQQFIVNNFADDDIAEIYDYRIPAYSKVTQDIQEHIKSAGRPFVPGSSLKGTIRTALLAYHLKNDELQNQKKKRPYIGGDVFGRFSEDILKNLKLSDTETLDKASLEIATVARYNLKTSSQEMITPREAIPAQKEMKFSLATTGKKDNLSAKFSYLYFGKEKQILRRLNEYARDYLQDEIQLLKDYNQLKEVYDKYVKLYNKAKKFQEDNNGALIRVGHSKGFYNNSIIRYYPDERKHQILKDEFQTTPEELFPKTKAFLKRDNQLVDSMGWAAIELIAE